MRELTDREKDLFQSLIGTSKSAIALLPVFGQAIAGWDAYKRSSFEREVKQFLIYLSEKVGNLETFCQHDYFRSEEGQLLTRKLVDAALDAQLEDKQELFVNALVNSPTNTQISELQKLKFIDMIRALSRSALLILADMHKMFSDDVRGPGRKPDTMKPYPLVDPGRIAETLSNRYEPYLVTAAINEMVSQGLFSNIGEWRKDSSGRHFSGGGFDTALCYTDFAAKFVEFITTDIDK